MIPFNFLTIRISFIHTLESWLAGIGLASISLGIFFTILFFNLTKNTIYQGIFIDDTDVSGLTKNQALDLLRTKQTDFSKNSFSLITDNISLASSGAQLNLHTDYQTAVNSAYELGRVGFPINRLITIIQLKRQPLIISSTPTLDENELKKMIEIFAAQVDVPDKKNKAVLKQTNKAESLSIELGKAGRLIDREKTLTKVKEVLNQFESNQTLSISPPVASVGAALNQEQAETAKIRAKKLVGKKISFKTSDVKLELNDTKLINLLSFEKPESKFEFEEKFTKFDQEAAAEIVQNWQSKIERKPQDAQFEFDQKTLKVKAFTPPRDGWDLNEEKVKTMIFEQLEKLEKLDTTNNPKELDQPLELPITISKPSKTLENTNNLGIKERIGFGESSYFHSIPNRVHNVNITAQKVTNYIVKPGEEFSFNKALGDVSAATGYKSAYVIKEGKTVLGDGGGVCQVSTTLFRSLLNAGLPITRRRQHSYRVSYYEYNTLPGLDATVYAGEVDLRFINDTDHHLLIHFENDPQNYYLKAEIYGTSDGRSAQIISHTTWDSRPAAATQYIDTTDIPRGKLQQIDWSAPGIRAKVVNQVKDKEGNVIRTDEYVSNYIPWSAKYLRGI